VDDDIPDAWTCSENLWDPAHKSCSIPQALSDEQIDEILMQQVGLHSCSTLCPCSRKSLCTPCNMTTGWAVGGASGD